MNTSSQAGLASFVGVSVLTPTNVTPLVIPATLAHDAVTFVPLSKAS